MSDGARSLPEAREAFARGDWGTALAGFDAAALESELDAGDLEAVGDSAWWLGDIERALTAYEGAYRLYLQGNEPRGAAISAVGLAVSLFLRGDVDLGSGWMSRARRLLRDEPEGPEHGLLLSLELEAALEGGDLDAVIDGGRSVKGIGERHDDASLVAIGILYEGRARVRRGEMEEGLALLDEAMVAVVSDDLVPEWTGNIYCQLMDAFHEVGDVRRARACVDATTSWLERRQGGAVFEGICRVHRSQVMQSRGAWDHAEREAVRVCKDLEKIHIGAAAEGHYQVGDIRRLRGDLVGAAEAYSRAHERGRDPQPGLALLRLAEGRVDAATASIRSALAAQPSEPLARYRLCAAQVEIALVAGEEDAAERACGELEATAAAYGTSGLLAMATHARGAVQLAQTSAEVALPTLRDACRRWRELDASYEAARVCLLLGDAYERLGDADAAQRERGAANVEFARLGAAPMATRARPGETAKVLPDGLTARQVEILALVADGRSNKQIADALVISQKTVARHLENVFTKLGLTSRSAAAAYAVQRGLVRGPRG